MEPLADKIEGLALELANEHFEANVQRIVEESGGRLEALIQATGRLAKPGNVAGSPQHIAFTYVAAAFDRVVEAPGSASSPAKY